MIPVDGVRRAWRWSVRKLLSRWVRVTIKPEDAAAQLVSRPRPLCYVLENESQTDLAVLHNTCCDLGLPSPDGRIATGEPRGGRAHLELVRRGGVLRRRAIPRAPRYLEQLIARAAEHPEFDVDLVPVAVYWGRAPHREVSLWRLLFTEDWALVGRFKKLLNVVFNGRNTLVCFGEPICLRGALEDAASAPRAVRRMLRTLRAALRAQRASTIGPDLSHRRTMVSHILHARGVREAVRREMQRRAAQGRPVTRRAALLTARRHALEIAANYSQAFITFMSAVLGRLWNRLYDGVEVEHVDNLGGIGDGAEIIYVPCHRSHMDYLLLSYVVYRKGFAVPHVAAGVNLNMPFIGRFLRMGGAFFLRRSFKGEDLYAAVFTQYLGVMMARGHPLEYFVEGGRSRTGRMMPPRTGMLSMTVRSFLHNPQRPVVFMPVYFGYERIVEGRTYIGELSGRPKEKESVIGLLRAVVAVMRKKFGKAHVNFGEPIRLDALLDSHDPRWRERGAGAADTAWVRAAVDDLATRVAEGINAAAAVTPVNLVAMAMLATPRQSLSEAALVRQVELYQRLLRLVPYGPLVTVTPVGGSAIIRYAEGMGILERQRHPLGDIMRMNEEGAVLATYYRNNVLHLLAMPSLIACGFLSNTRMRTADLQRLVWRVYPYIASELYLRWDEPQVAGVVDEVLAAFAELRLLEADAGRGEWARPAPASPEAIHLSLLAEATLQTLERYYLVVAILLQVGSGLIGRDLLIERCHLMAQRMTVLYGLNAPEFFDRSLFRNFIDLLCRRDVVQVSADGNILFGEPLLEVAADAQLVLSEQIRRSILQVTLLQ